LKKARETKPQAEGVRKRGEGEIVVLVCQGTGCLSGRSDKVLAALSSEVERLGLSSVKVDFTGCHGFCQQGPIVVVEPEGTFYTRVEAEDARDIAEQHLRDGRPVERLFYRDPVSNEPVALYKDIDFYKKQRRIVLRNCGRINPEKIDDYIQSGGYEGLQKALCEMEPAQVVEEVKKSGLRGRGGAGFPTGVKWEFCSRSVSDTKYVICNADEGDPGAFMDRSVMEADPHSVLEGLIIAAYAIGASKGYFYVRAEYPVAVTRLAIAIEEARSRGFLGENILGRDFSFDVALKEGAGAFVCGEETALMASIEGKRGMPRSRPPFPAQSGLWGKPTNINNVETLANVPQIIVNGADWFRSIGTETSAGTKVFALTGKVANQGLVEVPMGTPLYEVVFGIGGGILDNKRFKAVQTGGPSGGCLPAKLLNIEVDYESLSQAGSIMGSGGMVVLDEDTCIVDLARYFIEFTQNESCGKCTPCRLGTQQMLKILKGITAGRGRLEDVDLLLELAESVKKGALCGLGQTAPNPVLTTIRYFRDEYEAHIRWGKCYAAVCRELVEAPCRHTCPAGVDVPRYVRYINEGRFADALAVIRERIPFPSVCGRICVHPCETKCRRSQLDDPIAIRALKRVASEHGGAAPELTPAKPTGKRVAVIGAGPAGLTAAYYLSRLGHGVVVFEALPKPGGMMRVGIPRFRLTEDVLDAEIADIQRAGFEIKSGERVKSVESLLEDGYDAVFVGVGAHKGLPMGIPGEDSPGVMDCITLLHDVSLGRGAELSGRVAVVGGGNAAMDSARVAFRQGADEVLLLYRRTREQMPAADEEIEDAFSEGVRPEFLVVPVEISEKNGKKAVKCRRMTLGRIDSSGRPSPVPIEGSDFVIEVDTVITAIGQNPHFGEEIGCELDRRGWIRVDQETVMTPRAGVFAGGDVVTGPASVIEAIAAGRRAAEQVDLYLGGAGSIEEVFAPVEEAPSEGVKEEEGERRRVAVPKVDVEARLRSMDEVELGYTPELAMEEADRCLRCDLEEVDEE